MIIEYFNCPHPADPNTTDVRFILDYTYEKPIGSRFLTYEGRIAFIPEAGMIPKECKINLLVPIQEFEKAILDLADTIRGIKRSMVEPDNDEPIPQSCSATTIDKLIDIIQNLTKDKR